MAIKTGLLHIPALDDEAGQAIRQLLKAGLPDAYVILESYARSQRHWIEDVLIRWCDEDELDLLITVGGTLPAPGPSSREVTPEATLAVLERLMPGVAEAMRAEAAAVSELALLDRGVAGIRGRTLILNLPAGAGPAYLFLNAVVDVIAPTIAHLQESPAAPQLADALLLDVVEGVDPDAGQAASESDSDRAGGRASLDIDEFAAFLRRSGANPIPDDDEKSKRSSK